MRRSLAGALLALMLAAALICPAWGEDFRPLLENRPLTAGDSVSDWLAIASGRAGLQRPDYLRDLESYVTSMYRENGGLDRIKATEWHRITLAVLAQGGDPTAFGRDREGKPIDLVAEGTYNWSRSRSLGAQGLNGWIFALITLDSGGFAVPEGAAYTREDMIAAILVVLDGRRRFIYCSWRHPIANIKNIIGNVFRILAAILSVVLLSTYVIGLGTPGSGTYKWAKDNGYEPQLWNAIGDAQANNPATTFLSLSKVKAMDKPDNYSQKTMQSLAKKYAQEAQAINQTRSGELTDNTVIMILSETFSDPTRVPGVSFSLDPIPNIRNIKNTTTSGLMLSPGYGGGTANIEYQALTGLNLANFNDSLIVPYQQLVPNQNNPYSFNQIWMEKYGKNASTAVHPFQQSMYLRNINYRKFGFSYLYTLDSKVPLEHTGCIDRSPYVSDSEAYQSILDLLDKQQDSNSSQFLQLVTMQNHMPYGDYYDNNEFSDADISEDLSDGERWNINTYTKGINWTDQETADFLNQLDQIDKPITVIFYGDHLPGIYDTADMDKNNKTVLHETDYFIWSNSVSPSHDTKVNPVTAAYTSSNYFMPLAAEHMNAKVSPYLAMLTELQQEIPAMSRVIGANGGIGQGKATYLDHAGNNIKATALSAKAKRLLKDYKLVQYDQTVGKNYLEDLDFTQVP